MKGEGNIPLNWLSENPNFVMLKHFKFSNEELPFEACLFLHTAQATTPSPVAIELVYPDGQDPRLNKEDTTVVDLLSHPSAFQKWLPLQATVSGEKALEFKPDIEYGPAFLEKISTLHLKGILKSVTLNFGIQSDDSLKDIIGVVEIKDHDKQTAWEGMQIKQPLQPNKWNAIELHHSYPETVTNTDYDVNIYIWNKGKKKFYIKDFKIVFGSIPR